jgi:uncharacterized protein YecT (DUF1311 family)
VDQAARAGGQEQELTLRAIVAISAAAVLTGTAAFAFAGEQDDAEPHCDGSTYEIVECLKAQTAQWDKRLNAAYQQALKDAVSPKQAGQLRNAQRLWAQYRDANCLYYDLGEGTIARIETGYCTRDLTKTRALELEDKTEKH